MSEVELGHVGLQAEVSSVLGEQGGDWGNERVWM